MVTFRDHVAHIAGQLWQAVSPDSPLGKAALVFAIGLLVVQLLRGGIGFLLRRAMRAERIAPHAVQVILRGVTMLGYGLLLFVATQTSGLKLHGLWTLIGGALAVMGIGLVAGWSIFSNTTASVLLMLWPPCQLGDRIDFIEGESKLTGVVVDINLFFTELQEEDGSIVAIPNNQLFQHPIRRYPRKSSRFTV